MVGVVGVVGVVVVVGVVGVVPVVPVGAPLRPVLDLHLHLGGVGQSVVHAEDVVCRGLHCRVLVCLNRSATVSDIVEKITSFPAKGNFCILRRWDDFLALATFRRQKIGDRIGRCVI